MYCSYRFVSKNYYFLNKIFLSQPIEDDLDGEIPLDEAATKTRFLDSCKLFLADPSYTRCETTISVSILHHSQRLNFH